MTFPERTADLQPGRKAPQQPPNNAVGPPANRGPQYRTDRKPPGTF